MNNTHPDINNILERQGHHTAILAYRYASNFFVQLLRLESQLPIGHSVAHSFSIVYRPYRSHPPEGKGSCLNFYPYPDRSILYAVHATGMRCFCFQCPSYLSIRKALRTPRFMHYIASSIQDPDVSQLISFPERHIRRGTPVIHAIRKLLWVFRRDGIRHIRTDPDA